MALTFLGFSHLRQWRDDDYDYDVLEDGVVLGHIFFLDAVGQQGRAWMWASGHNGDSARPTATSRRAKPRWRCSLRSDAERSAFGQTGHRAICRMTKSDPTAVIGTCHSHLEKSLFAPVTNVTVLG
jgi:hypothetical protein